MKKFGLIGGIGPESSIEYYRKIVSGWRKKTGSNHYPEFVIHSIDMTEMLNYVFQGHLSELVDFLAERINVLERSGVEFAALASNTPHIVYDDLVDRVNIPLISIVEETVLNVKQLGIAKVGLFGTRSTMSAGFYQKVAKRESIDVITPEEDAQEFIHDKYMGELVFNQIIPSTKTGLIDIVNQMKDESQIEGLILGGTELPLILGQNDFPNLKILNTTEIHVDSIVEKMNE